MKPEVLEQLRLVIVQSLVQRMSFPLPTIHKDKPDLEFTLSNGVMMMRDLLPERIVLENKGRIAVSLADIGQSLETENVAQTFTLKM